MHHLLVVRTHLGVWSGHQGDRMDASSIAEMHVLTGRSSSVSALQGTDVSLSEHRDLVLWMGEMGRLFHFLPETFALGVCVRNRFLSRVKVGG